MLKKISIVFPIIGMTVLIVSAITSYFYYIEVKALKDTLLVKENSKAEDIYFIVESLIDREENKLSVLAITLKKHTDLMCTLWSSIGAEMHIIFLELQIGIICREQL